MSLKGDETNARAAAVMRTKSRQRAVKAMKATRGNTKDPVWLLEVRARLKGQKA